MVYDNEDTAVYFDIAKWIQVTEKTEIKANMNSQQRADYNLQYKQGESPSPKLPKSELLWFLYIKLFGDGICYINAT